MHHYSQGKSLRQAHKAIPDGHFEEEQGREGFFGPVSHLVKEKPSTRWTKISGPLKPRLFDLVELTVRGQMQRLLYNNDVALYNFWLEPSTEAEGKAYRDADGDLIYFCHKGAGNIWTEYGQLSFTAGSYIVIPKCVTHTFSPADLSNFFVIEARQAGFLEPDRGMLGRNAIYDLQTLGRPDLSLQQKSMGEKKSSVKTIEVRRDEEITTFEYAECIYDTVSWKGDFFPFTLHMNDLMPVMSHRVHLPPSAHTTFVSRGFVVCSFLPRPLEQDKDALKVPFYHQNIDYDEVLFYHNGDFFSRDNLHAGMMSFHPAGFPHGPHPKAVKSIDGKTETNESAVMIDTRNKLQRDPILDSVEFQEYWKSWQ